MAIRAEFWGDYALFSRPEMKVERISYDVPTPSAARGMLESIYWHPGMRWIIDKIYVMAPIQAEKRPGEREGARFISIRRNEVKSKISAKNGKQAMLGNTEPQYLAAFSDRTQRASLFLRDVHYVIEAHFEMTEKASAGDNPGKFQDIIKRRLKRGECYSQPVFGTRECWANFRLWEEVAVPTIPVTSDLGWMLYDMDYSDSENITPMFFRAKMENGVIDLRNCEVVR